MSKYFLETYPMGTLWEPEYLPVAPAELALYPDIRKAVLDSLTGQALGQEVGERLLATKTPGIFGIDYGIDSLDPIKEQP